MAGAVTLSWIDKLKDHYAAAITDYIIKAYAHRHKDFFFIQIGAFDGIRNNPIRKYILKYEWKGILVEPVKYIFDRLVNNYKGYSNLSFENIAISDKDEIKDFHFLREGSNNLVSYYEELGSLSSEVTLKHRDVIPGIEDYLVTAKVTCITLMTLLQRHNIKKVDLLQIDSEGYDYKIIASIDFKVIKPKVIIYERVHLNNYDSKQCISVLKNNGYTVIKLGVDAIAFLGPEKLNEKKEIP